MDETGTKGERRGSASGKGGGDHPLVGLRDEVDRLFDDFLAGFGGFGRKPVEVEPRSGLARMFGGTFPAVDMVEEEKDYRITAELPGLQESDVEVTLAGGTLTIKGEKKAEREEEKKGFHLSERRFGSFQRSFNLPEDADPGGSRRPSRTAC